MIFFISPYLYAPFFDLFYFQSMIVVKCLHYSKNNKWIERSHFFSSWSGLLLELPRDFCATKMEVFVCCFHWQKSIRNIFLPRDCQSWKSINDNEQGSKKWSAHANSWNSWLQRTSGSWKFMSEQFLTCQIQWLHPWQHSSNNFQWKSKKIIQNQAKMSQNLNFPCYK